MNPKTLIFICMGIGSYIGGYIPKFFGASVFSFYGLICGFVGGIAGIYIGYKISKNL
ncbi:MAG: hypothetical protein JW983_05885 [Elusimicrobia bacterium]|nr:hypothetical protein [Elusimicrobiota bacterium]